MCSTSTSAGRSPTWACTTPPDPSSQQACTIGGNVATNAGGPHCLASGVTSAHVLAVDVVLAGGEQARLGSLCPDEPGYDLRGCFVGSEGTMGIATKVAVRLTPDAPAVATMLCAFDSIDAAAATVTGTIAGGVLPAALEMMDAKITAAVEDFVGAGIRATRRPCCWSRSTASTAGSRPRSTRCATSPTVMEAVSVRSQPTTRNVRCSGRAASRRSARSHASRPTTTSTTRSCRGRVVEVLRGVYDIADAYELVTMNVFHAGDGNLHPLIVFDRREPGVDRVHDAGNEILTMCIEAGGVLTGEHGVGVEKRDLMPLLFTPDDLDADAPARRVRPDRRRQPAEGAAARQPLRRAAAGAGGRVDVNEAIELLAASVATAATVVPVGGRDALDNGGARSGAARRSGRRRHRSTSPAT